MPDFAHESGRLGTKFLATPPSLLGGVPGVCTGPDFIKKKRPTEKLSLSVRHDWLAQFGETLVIASSALGSARRLIAKRRTPFSPRAHYELSIWFWAHSYARWPRPHELGELHDSTPTLTDANSQLLTFG